MKFSVVDLEAYLPSTCVMTALTFHGLRGTAVTKIALAGRTATEIATVTVELERREAMLVLHCFGGREDLVSSALQKMMRSTSPPALMRDGAVWREGADPARRELAVLATVA